MSLVPCSITAHEPVLMDRGKQGGRGRILPVHSFRLCGRHPVHVLGGLHRARGVRDQ